MPAKPKPDSTTRRAPQSGPAPAGKPAGALPVDEEAHFRLDEQERRMAQIEENVGPDVIAGLVRGAAAAFHTGLEDRVRSAMDSQTERLLAAVKQDIETDRGIISALAELVAQLRTAPKTPDLMPVLSEMRALLQHLTAPRSRTGTIDLPSGPVKLTIKELPN